METSSDKIEAVIDRLNRIEDLLSQIIEQRTVKEWYTIAEVANCLGRSEYTVREWCRKMQIPANKAANGRDWIVSHQTLVSIKNRELPIPEHQAHGVFNCRRK
jgi:hypothetical protein